jgi:hypothetical protein
MSEMSIEVGDAASPTLYPRKGQAVDLKPYVLVRGRLEALLIAGCDV